MRSRGLRLVMALAGGLALLAGCTNTPGGIGGVEILKNMQKARAAGAAPAALDPAALSKALASTTEPVILIVTEATKTPNLSLRIGSNGDFDTYANQSRQSLTLKDGLIVATRGLGDDLLSSSTGGAEALIRARKAGTVKREMRFLNAENQVIQRDFTCAIAPGPVTDVPSATGTFRATQVVERCVRPGLTLDHAYFVNAQGQIVQSRQWVGPRNGYLLVQQLKF